LLQLFQFYFFGIFILSLFVKVSDCNVLFVLNICKKIDFFNSYKTISVEKLSYFETYFVKSSEINIFSNMITYNGITSVWRRPSIRAQVSQTQRRLLAAVSGRCRDQLGRGRVYGAEATGPGPKTAAWQRQQLQGGQVERLPGVHDAQFARPVHLFAEAAQRRLPGPGPTVRPVPGRYRVVAGEPAQRRAQPQAVTCCFWCQNGFSV